MTQHMCLHSTIPSRCSTFMKGLSYTVFKELAGFLLPTHSTSPPLLLFPSTFLLFLFLPIILPLPTRYQCGMPVIIEGETGVGKTALVEMLFKLWNHALLGQWKRQRNRLLDFIRKKLGDISIDISDNYQVRHNI